MGTSTAPSLNQRCPAHAFWARSSSGTTLYPKSRSASSMPPCRSASKRRSEEHTSEIQSLAYLVCRLLLEKKNKNGFTLTTPHKHFLLYKYKNDHKFITII